MKMLSFGDFLEETLGGNALRERYMHLYASPVYEKHSFKCSCGKEHQFSLLRVRILRELPKKMGFVFECPDDPHYLTCVKLIGLLRFKGFDTLFGTKIGEEGEAVDIGWLYANEEEAKLYSKDKKIIATTLLLAYIRHRREVSEVKK